MSEQYGFWPGKKISKWSVSILVSVLILIILSSCGQTRPFLIHDPFSPVSTTTLKTAQSTEQNVLKTTSSFPTKTLTPKISPGITSTLTVTIGVKNEELKGQVVLFWHPWDGATKKVIDKLVEEFNLKNPWGILANSVAFPGYDRLTNGVETSLPTTNSPQVVAGLLHQALQWDQQKPLVDLQPYMSDQNWGFEPEEQAEFYPIFWDQTIIQGRRLGIPAYQTGQIIFYNQTWARELGYKNPPATTEQFRQQACAAAQANLDDDDLENNGTGGLILSTDPGVLLGWMEAFGSSPSLNANKTPSTTNLTTTSQPQPIQSAYQFNTPEFEDAHTFLRKMYDDDCAWLSKNQTSEDHFVERMGLFTTESVTHILQQSEAFKRTGNQDQWTVIPFPSPTSEPVIVTTGPFYFLLPGTPQQQLASWLFIRWLSSSENNAKIIESNGAFPIRADALTYLSRYKDQNPQWGAAIELTKYAKSEPAFSSWGKVRRALGDAATQLYRSYFSVDQIPAMLNYLDNFAEELHLGAGFLAINMTPTLTPGKDISPSQTQKPATPNKP